MESGGRTRRRKGNTPRRLSEFSHFRSRLFLFFARRCVPCYSRLSGSVLREVSSFLWFHAKVLSQGANSLWGFSPATQSWTLECVTPVDRWHDRVIASVYFGESEAFIQTFRAPPITACHIIRSRQLTDIPPLARNFFGAIYDAPRMRICCFGGVLCERATTKCSQLLLRTEEWRSLPSMHTEKCFFSPCWFRHKIYLLFQDIEVFDPQTDSFSSVLTLPLLPSLHHYFTSIAVPDQDEIIIITHMQIAAWRPGSDIVCKVCDICAFPALRFQPVVAGQWMYFADGFCAENWCGAINIRTGKSEKLTADFSQAAAEFRRPDTTLARVLE